MDTSPKQDSNVSTMRVPSVTVSTEPAEVVLKGDADTETREFERGSRFWMIFVALCCCTLLSALDLVNIILK